MGSKFGIRPAPRKRPWICKKGPPALAMPADPPGLVATVSLRPLTGLPRAPDWSQTILLLPTGPFGPYIGATPGIPVQCTITFHWYQGQPTAIATGTWDLPSGPGAGTWPTAPVAPNPYLRYESHVLEILGLPKYETELVITA